MRILVVEDQRKVASFIRRGLQEEGHAVQSLLMIPLVGFLPPDDPRVRGTVAAIQDRLSDDGFVLRYRTRSEVDGLPPGERAFLLCTFWLADNLALQGRRDGMRFRPQWCDDTVSRRRQADARCRSMPSDTPPPAPAPALTHESPRAAASSVRTASIRTARRTGFSM